MGIAERLDQLGLTLPAPPAMPPGVEAWVSVSGFVNAQPGYATTTAVLNAFSEVLDVFGPEVGRHARTAIGVAALPLDLPVVVGAELLLAT